MFPLDKFNYIYTFVFIAYNNDVSRFDKPKEEF